MKPVVGELLVIASSCGEESRGRKQSAGDTAELPAKLEGAMTAMHASVLLAMVVVVSVEDVVAAGLAEALQKPIIVVALEKSSDVELGSDAFRKCTMENAPSSCLTFISHARRMWSSIGDMSAEGGGGSTCLSPVRAEAACTLAPLWLI